MVKPSELESKLQRMHLIYREGLVEFPGESKILFHRGNMVYVINADGSNQKLVDRGGGEGGKYHWSPDGSQILVERYERFHVKDSETLEEISRIRYTRGTTAAWSPDSKRIAFSNNNRLYATTVDGKETDFLGYANASQPSPRWSTDSRNISYYSNDMAHILKVIDVESKNELRSMYNAIDPYWLPDGSIMLKGYTGKDQEMAIFLWNDQGNLNIVTKDSKPFDFIPNSRMGILMNFTNNGFFTSQCANRTASRYGKACCWSPDSEQIIYIENQQMHIMLDSGEFIRILGYGYNPSFSPDGMFIAYERGGSLYTISQFGTSYKHLIDGSNPKWCPV
jgi:dipeptidyl aminopeptidase/acylaminoacyl peptidase